MTNWGPWIKGCERPKVDGSTRMQACYINDSGILCADCDGSWSVAIHHWDNNTLAYRLEVKDMTYTLYGLFGGDFTDCEVGPYDTHKITYVVRNGDVISCKMEKL